MSLRERLEKQAKAQEAGADPSSAAAKVDPYKDLKSAIHERLVAELGAEMLKKDGPEDQAKLRARVEEIANSVIDEKSADLIRSDRLRLVAEVIDEVTGFGPITGLLLDPTVSEIMVNGPNQVYVERKGKLVLSDVTFRDSDHVMHIIERIVSPLGRRIDESSPMVDARLPDGSRVNAIIPPISLKGPCITIRKFSKDPFTVGDLINFGTLTVEMAKFLEAAVKVRLNIVVSGGTGSGKCVTYETPIMVGSGDVVPIGRLVEDKLAARANVFEPDGWVWCRGGEEVISYDFATRRFVRAKIQAYFRHRAPDELFEVTTVSGRTVTVTGEHPFFVMRGGRIEEVRAEELLPGEAIAVPAPEGEAVEGRPADLYELLEGIDGLRVAGDPGLAVALALGMARRRALAGARRLAAAQGGFACCDAQLVDGNAISVPEFAGLLKGFGMSLGQLGEAHPDRALTFTAGKGARGGKARIPRSTSPELMRFYGLVLAGGTVDTDGVRFEAKDPALHREFLESGTKLFGVSGYRSSSAARWSRIRSEAVAVFLRDVLGIPFGEGRTGRKIPGWVHSLTRDEVVAFLQGFIGWWRQSCSRGGIMAYSKEFASSLSFLALRAGLWAELDHGPDGWCVRFFAECPACAAGYPGLGWDPVAGVRRVSGHGHRYVYDVTVEGTHNFVAGFGGMLAHNTTTLNVLSSFIPPDERIVTIEDAAELQLRQDHVVPLETRPPNIEGKGAITMRDLVRNALRMRPDRIVVGEVRGGEALDMLQAMNTGHDGSLTTGHANSPRDMLSRLETMVLMAGMELPVRAIREQIASGIDLIVHQSRLRDGSRKITAITEVVGMEGDIITLQDIFVFEQRSVDERGRVIGKFRATGIRPKCADKFEAAGIHLPSDIYAAF